MQIRKPVLTKALPYKVKHGHKHQMHNTLILVRLSSESSHPRPTAIRNLNQTLSNTITREIKRLKNRKHYFPSVPIFSHNINGDRTPRFTVWFVRKSIVLAICILLMSVSGNSQNISAQLKLKSVNSVFPHTFSGHH